MTGEAVGGSTSLRARRGVRLSRKVQYTQHCLHPCMVLMTILYFRLPGSNRVAWSWGIGFDRHELWPLKGPLVDA